MNWFATGLPFSSSFNALYFTFEVTSWCFLFVAFFYRVSHQKSNSNKFKDFTTFEYYGIRIKIFELTTVKYRRLKKIDSETKIRITWWKICLRLATLLKKRLCHKCFPVNFVKFLRTPFLQNTSGRLLLKSYLKRSKNTLTKREVGRVFVKPEPYLELSRTSMMKLFCHNS